MQKLLIKAVSEPKEYGQAKWFEVTDGEGKIYAGTKMEQRARFIVGQLNEVEIKVVEGKKKPRIELVSSPMMGKPDKVNVFQPETVEVDTKLRSMVCAYAKDLACYGKIDIKDIEGFADYFLGYIMGGTKPNLSPEATRSTGKPPEPPGDSEVLVEEAVELGGELILSAEEIKVRVARLIEANKALKVGTFVAMMEKLQAGATGKSEKNKFGNATLVGVYQVLNDDNKIKFAKQILEE